MVTDVEGTDGRERGKDQDFERKSVLIANLWEHRVGLYPGVDMGLLKTVFEVNLGLFDKAGSSQKTMLPFVIREHIGATTELPHWTASRRHFKSICKRSGMCTGQARRPRREADYITLCLSVVLV
ncbi:hypothetical protein RSAG8_13106, partial [Rhizoctonia solani AG-8 WAC10335]